MTLLFVSACYITMIEITSYIEENVIIWDKMFYFPENGIGQLGYKNGRLMTMVGKCRAVRNQTHSFDANWVDEKKLHNTKTNGTGKLDCCYFCLSKFDINHVKYDCKQCNYSICYKCFDCICFNMKPPNVKSCHKITIRNMNEKNSIAVWIGVESRKIVPETSKYLWQFGKIEDYYQHSGFTIVDANGGSHLFYTVWKSCHLTVIKLTANGIRDVIYDAMFDPDIEDENVQLYCKDSILAPLAEIIPQCMSVSNESHPFMVVCGNNDEIKMKVEKEEEWDREVEGKAEFENETRLIHCSHCILCSSKIKANEFGYYCKQCDHTICRRCFDSLCVNQISPGVQSKGTWSQCNIKNMLKMNKIAVLAGYNAQTSKRLIKTVEYTAWDEQDLVAKGFVILNARGGSHWFDALWRYCYLIVLKIQAPLPRMEKNVVIYNGSLNFKDDVTQIYCSNDKIVGVPDGKVKCRTVYNESHSLRAIWNNQDQESKQNSSPNMDVNKVNSNSSCCVLCLSTIKLNTFSYYCQKCKHSLCSDCFDSLCLNEISYGGRKLNIKNMSEKSKIAVLVHINDGKENKIRNDMIDTSKYKHFKNENEFVENGFIVVDTYGGEKWVEMGRGQLFIICTKFHKFSKTL